MEDTFKYRLFWTWDYCTRWDHSNFVRGRGATGPNQRRSHFLQDYCRMVDFAAQSGINGIVIWGALRAHNNGEDQLRYLVKYGRERGVRILPGVGVFSYGGVYYDPRRALNSAFVEGAKENDYSLHAWLARHPEYRAIGKDGVPHMTGIFSDVACPSQVENVEWFKRALEWLFTELDVDGVQVEVGDYFVCHCDRCEGRRRGRYRDARFAAEDMAQPYLIACEVASRAKEDAWVVCETYSSFADRSKQDTFAPVRGVFGGVFDEEEKGIFSGLPDNAILQWVMDRAVGLRPVQRWNREVSLPHRENVARIHAGSQWSLNSNEEWAMHPIGDLVAKARRCGVNGVSIFGEESPVSPPNEANYLIFSEFCGYGNPNPECDLARFYSNTLDPLYGGSGFAKEWERLYITGHIVRLHKAMLADSARDPLRFHPVHLAIGDDGLLEWASAMSPTERQTVTEGLAVEAHDIGSKLSGDACRRWSWLENWLWRAEYLHRTDVAAVL